MKRPRSWLLLPLLLLGASSDPGQVAYERGDMPTAIIEWSTALKGARAAGDKAGEAELLLRLASAHRQLGRLKSASDLLDQAVAAGADPAAIAIGRGLVRYAAGDARGAEKLFKEGFGAAQARQDPQTAMNAAVNLGMARTALGRHAEARKALDGALQLAGALKDPVAQGDALNNRGLSFRRDGRLAEARADLEAALLLFRGAGAFAAEADAQANLALILSDLGRPEAARQLLDASLVNARSRRDLERQGAIHLALGRLGGAEAAGHYAAAVEAYTQAGRPADAATAALARAALSQDAAAFEAVLASRPDKRTEAIASLNLASLKGDLRLAERALSLAEELALAEVRWRARALRGRLRIDAGKSAEGVADLRAAVDELESTRKRLDEGDAQRFVMGHEPVYQALIDALLASGDSAGAFLYAQRLQLADLGAPPVPDSPELQAYNQGLQEQAWLEASIAGAADPEQAQALREQLARQKVEFAATVDTLRATYPAFGELVRMDPEDLEAVQSNLEPGVVVLQPVLLPDQLVLMVLRRDRLRVVRSPADPALVGKQVARLARALRAGNTDPSLATTFADPLGAALLDPVAAELEGAKILVVTPAGVFRQLPFAMLRRGGRWLVQDMAAVAVTHVGSLGRKATDTARFRVDGPHLLLVGDPDGSLPGARDEVKAIAGQLPGATVQVGSIQDLPKQVQGRTALHLATHGVVDPEHPELSYLVTGPDQRLAYGEIPGLAPWMSEARLVVLSACESGLPVDMPEGSVAISINGLSAQFRRAGVETLVASLWKVDDEGTRELMIRFYSELSRGADIARAMQAAQLSLIEDPELAQPWYWASFVVFGDWR